MTQTTPPTKRVLIPIQTEGVWYLREKNPHYKTEQYPVANSYIEQPNKTWVDFERSVAPIPCLFTPEQREYQSWEVEEVKQEKLVSGTFWINVNEFSTGNRYMKRRAYVLTAVEPDPTYTKSQVIGIIEAVLKRAAERAYDVWWDDGELSAVGNEFKVEVAKTPYLDLLIKTK